MPRSWVPQHRERIFIVGFREPNWFSFDDFVVSRPAQGDHGSRRFCTLKDGQRTPLKVPYTLGAQKQRLPTSTRFPTTCGTIFSGMLKSTEPPVTVSVSGLLAQKIARAPYRPATIRMDLKFS